MKTMTIARAILLVEDIEILKYKMEDELKQLRKLEQALIDYRENINCEDTKDFEWIAKSIKNRFDKSK